MAGEALSGQNPARKRCWGRVSGGCREPPSGGLLWVGDGRGKGHNGGLSSAGGARLQRWSGEEEAPKMSQGASGDHVESVHRLRPSGGWLGGCRCQWRTEVVLGAGSVGPSPIDPLLGAGADAVVSSSRSDVMLAARGSSYWMPQGVLRVCPKADEL
jgi:hypothetical protein